ncbi:hypothetical protein [Embleya sp. MST-111070]|uniref:hypothetical protein n=1 Tax=Embleya sp. MST-111070 TaxID=3398231 RepID=UPI003F73FD28
MDRSGCSTTDHVFLEYAVKKGLAIDRVRWRHVFRDSIWGLAITLLLIGVTWALFGPVVPFVIAGVFVGWGVLCLGYRLARGHRPGCAARLATLSVFRFFENALDAVGQ